MEMATKYDPRLRDDQHQRPTSEGDAARVRREGGGGSLGENM